MGVFKTKFGKTWFAIWRSLTQKEQKDMEIRYGYGSVIMKTINEDYLGE